MAHQPVAIKCASADGRAESAGSVEPGLPTDHGSIDWSIRRASYHSVRCSATEYALQGILPVRATRNRSQH